MHGLTFQGDSHRSALFCFDDFLVITNEVHPDANPVLGAGMVFLTIATLGVPVSMSFIPSLISPSLSHAALFLSPHAFRGPFRLAALCGPFLMVFVPT